MRRKGFIATLAVATAVSLGAAGLAAAPAGAAIPFIDATTFKAVQTPEIPVGFGGGIAGDLTIGTSTTMFQAGDTITVSLDDSDSVANCFNGLGFRDFVAFAGTPTAHIPGPTATVQVNMGSSPLCASQDGGTQLDVMTVNVLIGGPGPITVTNIRYTAGSNGSAQRLGRHGSGAAAGRRRWRGRPAVHALDGQHLERVAHDDLAVGWHGERADHPAVAAGRDLAARHRRSGRRRVRSRRHRERRLPRHIVQQQQLGAQHRVGVNPDLGVDKAVSVVTVSTASPSRPVRRGRARG